MFTAEAIFEKKKLTKKSLVESITLISVNTSSEKCSNFYINLPHLFQKYIDIYISFFLPKAIHAYF